MLCFCVHSVIVSWLVAIYGVLGGIFPLRLIDTNNDCLERNVSGL